MELPTIQAAPDEQQRSMGSIQYVLTSSQARSVRTLPFCIDSVIVTTMFMTNDSMSGSQFYPAPPYYYMQPPLSTPVPVPVPVPAPPPSSKVERQERRKYKRNRSTERQTKHSEAPSSSSDPCELPQPVEPIAPRIGYRRPPCALDVGALILIATRDYLSTMKRDGTPSSLDRTQRAALTAMNSQCRRQPTLTVTVTAITPIANSTWRLVQVRLQKHDDNANTISQETTTAAPLLPSHTVKPADAPAFAFLSPPNASSHRQFAFPASASTNSDTIAVDDWISMRCIANGTGTPIRRRGRVISVRACEVCVLWYRTVQRRHEREYIAIDCADQSLHIVGAYEIEKERTTDFTLPLTHNARMNDLFSAKQQTTIVAADMTATLITLWFDVFGHFADDAGPLVDDAVAAFVALAQCHVIAAALTQRTALDRALRRVSAMCISNAQWNDESAHSRYLITIFIVSRIAALIDGHYRYADELGIIQA